MIASATVWMRVPRPVARRRATLICLPHAGAGASIYYPWARRLEQAGIELRAVQYPGREDRINEPPVISRPALVAALADALGEGDADRPEGVFGHSMGAVIAYELAHELRRVGPRRLPSRLFLSGRNPPHLRTNFPCLHDLPDEEFIARLVSDRDARLPKEVLENREMRAVVTAALKADYALSDAWADEAEAPLGMPFSIFGGCDDPWTSEASLAEWRRYSTRSCALRMIKGDHFFHQTSGDEVMAAIEADLLGEGR